MDEQRADTAGSGVKILVTAPNSKVYVPVVQLELNVPGCMSKVPADGKTFGVRMGCDGFDIPVLASIVLNAR